eukprot:6209064-Pleurochrysis_carterae.AAC.1
MRIIVLRQRPACRLYGGKAKTEEGKRVGNGEGQFKVGVAGRQGRKIRESEGEARGRTKEGREQEGKRCQEQGNLGASEGARNGRRRKTRGGDIKGGEKNQELMHSFNDAKILAKRIWKPKRKRLLECKFNKIKHHA